MDLVRYASHGTTRTTSVRIVCVPTPGVECHVDTAPADLLGRGSPFQVLDARLARDVRASIRDALAMGAVFEFGDTPNRVFRRALDASIASIQEDPRGRLLQRLLTQGPYEDIGPIPNLPATARLTDDEVASATAFVFSSMVNSFQGRLAELLASSPICNVVGGLRSAGQLPRGTSVYFGDSVAAFRPSGRGRAKAADIHLLAFDTRKRGDLSVEVLGVGEVKSYHASARRVLQQLTRHIDRCHFGLSISNQSYARAQVKIARQPHLFWIEPDFWKLPRTFHFETADGRSFLHTDAPPHPRQGYKTCLVGDGLHRITLRWSREALAAAAYSMTFWYMERVGEAVFHDSKANPWPEMSPAEAGRNAATSALYYAILRARNAQENNRAIALYNMYGFGYALGMNYVDAKGKRQMLWPADLREIAANGVSREGCRIAE